ncbi:LamG-like jellyroll fold domain-containing protein [Bdellovibrio sp. HCB-110]|uniref:LamG-like jellyroll fold domain-containing protein n=1 Tax=Bdellovibrio sp. HCB-110 TaxID=3391182 RepID=UPI0039B52331
MFPFIKNAKLLLASSIVGVMATPVTVVPGETVALWNFNETTGPTVSDQVTEGGVASGTSSPNVQIVSASSLGSGFGSARDFTVAGSYIDLGEISETKLDLKTKSEAAIEAVIYLNEDANSPVTIFDNRQLQLQVINNRLAAFVRQSSGFKGVVGSVLNKNTPYRVGAYFKNGYLVLSVDNKIVGNVRIPEVIQPAENGAAAYIGGDVSSMNFPGLVDDVRLSKVVTLDTVPPEISVQSPDLSVPVIHPKPTLNFLLTDNQNQIDPTTIAITLNGQPVTGLSFNATTAVLSGQLSANLAAGRKNIIGLSVKDQVGNPATAQFEVKYIKAANGEEYGTDSDTLGLWHLNDNGVTWAKDSTVFARHGKFKGTQPVLGILGQARLFSNPYDSDAVILPPVPIPGSTFTFEAWVKPLNDQAPLGDIFNNDQISVQRADTGSVIVNLKTYYQTHTYTTTVGALPAGKWSHVKVVYDGNLSTENLLVLIDGMIITAFDAVPDCEFDDEPKIARIGGNGYIGEIDEVRLSKNIRENTNLVRGYAPTIELAYPVEFETYRTASIGIYAKLRDTVGVTIANTQVKLNGIVQSGSSLTITGSEIKGTLPTSLVKGLNEIEIRVKGMSGNQTVLQRRFFYLEDGGLVENATDVDTAGLWHFNEDGGTVFADASGNNRPMRLVYPQETVVGKFGNAQKISSDIMKVENFTFPGKNFTIEGWFKGDVGTFNSSTYNIWSLNGNYFGTMLSRENRNLKISVIIPGAPSFNATIPEVINEDQYHHIAVVHDGQADSSNILVLVDGTVRYQRSLRVYCKSCMSALTFELHNLHSFDEVRVSSVARKRFNIGMNQGPAIGFLETLPLSTVHTSQPEFKVMFSDYASIDAASMSLAVNGVVDTTLTTTVSGTTGTLSGPISLNLENGANEITVRAKNQLGRESVKTFYVFYITKGSPTSYAPDSSTLGLWHFNAGGVSEILGDVSGRAFNWDGLSSPSLSQGIFGESLDISNDYGNMTASASIAPDTNSWTFETWIKLGANGSIYQVFDSYNFLSVDTLGAITFGVAETKTTQVGTLPQDGKFHHVAVIVDSANMHRQVLLVVDGTVVDSMRKADLPYLQFGYANANWSGVLLDEMRLSNSAQYTLSYERPVSTLFKKSNWAFKRKK